MRGSKVSFPCSDPRTLVSEVLIVSTTTLENNLAVDDEGFIT